jgi:hypothetical protein
MSASDAGLALAIRLRYAWVKAGTGAMRILVLISSLLAVLPAHASMLGCETKTADPQYCHNGERRSVCIQDGRLVWADTREAVSNGEVSFLASDGPVAKPRCAAAAAPAAAPAPAPAK